MIVADSNIVAYLLIPGPMNVIAERVLLRDQDWIAPMLWRSELRNILAVYMRVGGMTFERATYTMNEAEKILGRHDYAVPSDLVLDWANRSGLTAYDSEFVALADVFNVTLVTADKQIFKAVPKKAVLLENYIS